MNKETLQNYNSRLNVNNTSLEDIINDINNLPEVNGTLDITVNGEVDVTPYKMARVEVYTPPKLQDKSITITENGVQNITADEGYDGLNNVEITTNVESGTSIEIPDPLTSTNIGDVFNQSNKNIVDALLLTTNTNTPGTEKNITLYTPIDTHKFYFIRKNASGYHLIWCEDFILMPDTTTSLKNHSLRFKLGYIKNNSSELTIELYSGVSACYVSTSAFGTLEECIAAAEDRNTTYTKGTNGTSWGSTIITNEEITPYSNMLCFNKNGDLTPSRKISSNETIEVIS